MSDNSVVNGCCGRLPLGADPLVGCDVDGICDGLVAHRQPQVRDGAGAVLLDQNVLGLQIAVSNAWLAYTANNEEWVLVDHSTSEVFRVRIISRWHRGSTCQARLEVVLLTLRAQDLHVKVRQATGCRQGQLDHALDGDRVAVQEVEQRTILMVVRHQPQLSPRAIIWGK